jgi:Flp pilus assembly pilin Flp
MEYNRSVLEAGMLARLFGDERGQTLIEYGMVIGLVAISLIAGLTMLKGSLDSYYSDLTALLGSIV